jgi:hypothetical protein
MNRLHHMFERTSPNCNQPVPLSLAAGQRLVTPQLDPVLGWIGGESERVAQPLSLPRELIEPRATGTVSYACNLPKPLIRARAGMTSAPDTAGCNYAIERESAATFLAGSLPGGQVSIVMPDGRAGVVRLRWASLQQAAGSAWRCFLHLRTGDTDGAWTPVAHEYIFDASGFLKNEPGNQMIAFGDYKLTLQHPQGLMTCLHCKSGRVKITRLEADGWRKRGIASLTLHSDRRIAARFSDGKQKVFATAAPPRAIPAIAA